MASHGHCDVNLSPATWHRAGGFLAEFAQWLNSLGFHTWTVGKEQGNHLTPFWLYTRMDSGSPAKSQIQFGCTGFANVNPKIHAYARGKANHLPVAMDLLRHFVDEVWAFEAQDHSDPEPTPAHQHENWQLVHMAQYQCPNSGRIWYACEDDDSLWFMPDDTASMSMCGQWKAFQDEYAVAWWCRESRGQVFFPPAAA